MDTTQEGLRRYLTRLLGERPGAVEDIEAWWQAERSNGETFDGFLGRQGVLVPGASRTLQLIAKGYLTDGCQTSLVTADGVERLERVMRQASAPAVPEGPASAPAPARPPSGLTPRPPKLSGSYAVVGSRPLIDTVPTASAPRNSPSGTYPASRPPTPGDPRPGAWPPQPGTVLGKYLLTELVGKGTSGLVFRAVNQVLNLSVAVKVLRGSGEEASAGLAERLREEARLLAILNHPNLVRLWDFDADPAMPYLVMEYVEGLSLAELIKQCGRLTLERAVGVTRQVADGLAAAWKYGIVHRDIKPHNILVTRDGTAKIADLGLAVVVDEESALAPAAEQAGVAGTAAYMAPEQGLPSGTRVDWRADIYSLGATLYHAVTGVLPFKGSNHRELLLKHLHERPAPPHEVAPGLSPEVSDVVLTMMAREPDDRYQTGEELHEALGGLLAPARA